MKRILTSIVGALFCLTVACAQGVTEAFTVYNSFRPAVIHLTNGRDIKNPLTNVFLKNASLLFMRGSLAMEADMETIAGVDFDDHKYVKIDKMLCCLLDSVGNNRLYAATVIDFEAYNQMLRNNVNITNFSLFDTMSGDQINYTTVGEDPQEKQQMPLINHFYYLFDGKIVKVHERELSRVLPKNKKRIYKTIISMEDFQWTDKNSLMKLLEAISRDTDEAAE